MKKYKVDKGFSFDFMDDFPWKKILVALCIIVILAGIAVVVIYARSAFRGADKGGKQSYAFNTSLPKDSLTIIPEGFVDEVAELVQFGTTVDITFRVETGRSVYESEWKSPDTLLKITETNQRYTYFLNNLLPDLQKSMDGYNKACNEIPFKAFAVCIDVTEGYKNTNFSLIDYIGKDGVAWINNPQKQSSLFVFAIGYNSVPGQKRINDINSGNIDRIEQSIQEFLSEVQKELDSTQLLSQIAYIMQTMNEFPGCQMVLVSDLLENVPGDNGLSAYRKDARFDKFVSGDWTSYQKRAMAKANANESSFETSGDMYVRLPKGLNSAYGKNSTRNKWYDAVKQYLTESYSNVKFTFDF
jgi:hypothetical protein